LEDKIIAYVDKTIVKITGIRVHGIKPVDLEKAVAQSIGSPVRVIGVSSESIQMDIYGLEPEAVLRDATGLIRTISLIPGLTATDVAQIATAEKAREISAEELAKRTRTSCPKENWVGL
jgi:predicted nucleic acid-binding protein